MIDRFDAQRPSFGRGEDRNVGSWEVRLYHSIDSDIAVVAFGGVMSAAPISVVPEAGDVELARDALRLVDEALTESASDDPVIITVVGATEDVVVPRTVVGLLSRILANLANGEGVALIPVDRELSTQKAADILNVSRPFLIRLLDEGRIDFRMVGTHRRVKTASLLRYLGQDESERHAAADELSRMTKELGFV